MIDDIQPNVVITFYNWVNNLEQNTLAVYDPYIRLWPSIS